MTKDLDSNYLLGVLKLLSDETRLRILAILRDAELSVGELQKIMGVGQSTLSSQLGLLREQNLTTTRKDGQRVYYQLAPEILEDGHLEIVIQTLEKVEKASWWREDKAKLEKILNERSESSTHFFDSFKDEEIQSPGQTWESLVQGLFYFLPQKNVVDLGCGSGRLSFMLYQAGKNVVGIDSSEERIKQANKRLSEAKKNPMFNVSNSAGIEFHQTYMEKTGLDSNSVDLVIISQSLHHVATPLQVLKESARILKKGGKVFILDLLGHQQEWFRDKFGDFWLGFSPSDIKKWLSQSGFKEGHVSQIQQSNDYPEIQTLLVTGEKE